MNKKGITAIVAMALILIIAVISVVGFQNWFKLFSTKIYTNVETQSINSNNMELTIETLIGTDLYIKNNNQNNISINQIKIDGIVCTNLSINISSGVKIIDLSNCSNINNGQVKDITVITNKNIFSKFLFKKDANYNILTNNTQSLNITYPEPQFLSISDLTVAGGLCNLTDLGNNTIALVNCSAGANGATWGGGAAKIKLPKDVYAVYYETNKQNVYNSDMFEIFVSNLNNTWEKVGYYNFHDSLPSAWSDINKYTILRRTDGNFDSGSLNGTTLINSMPGIHNEERWLYFGWGSYNYNSVNNGENNFKIKFLTTDAYQAIYNGWTSVDSSAIMKAGGNCTPQHISYNYTGLVNCSYGLNGATWGGGALKWKIPTGVEQIMYEVMKTDVYTSDEMCVIASDTNITWEKSGYYNWHHPSDVLSIYNVDPDYKVLVADLGLTRGYINISTDLSTLGADKWLYVGYGSYNSNQLSNGGNQFRLWVK